MMYHSASMNGPYSLPPPGIMNEQYASNPVPSLGQHNSGMHQQINQSSHHFVPISTMSLQTDGYSHPMVTSPSASTHSFAPK